MQRLSSISNHVTAAAAEAAVLPEVHRIAPCATAGDAGEGPAVLYELQGHVLVLTLNRGSNRNAMSQEMLSAVRDAARQAASDDRVRCVVLTAKGRNFCGGADFSAGAKKVAGSGGEHAVGGETSMATYDHFLALLDIQVPIVGALQGHAIGGGFGLAFCCDIRVCHATSQYGANFVRLGIHPGMATTYFLPRLVGLPRALELLLTGRLFDGREAAQLGVASDTGETQEEVLGKAMAIAEQIAANAPIAVRWTKRSVYRHAGGDARAAAWDEANLQSWTMRTDDMKEGTRALLEKRVPNFKGR